MIETGYFDHTILKAEATEAQVAKICEEAQAMIDAGANRLGTSVTLAIIGE